MPVNHYFQSFRNQNEQRVLDGLIQESIKIFGADVYYLPRTQQNTDKVLGEDSTSTFDSSYIIEMYLENVQGFEGDKNWLSRYGLNISKSSTFVVSATRFTDVIRNGSQNIPPDIITADPVRPKEGDLIYFPLTRGLFEIKFVDHESVFYQLGKTYIWTLSAEMFQYSNEKFDTGIPEVDAIAIKYNNANSLSNEDFTDNIEVTKKLDAILDINEEADPFSLRNY